MQTPARNFRWITISATLCLSFALAGCGSSATNGGGIKNPPPPPASNDPFWAQWGSTAQHSGAIPVAVQALNSKKADIVYDPFVEQEQNEEFGELVDHYQATLTDGDDF